MALLVTIKKSEDRNTKQKRVCSREHVCVCCSRAITWRGMRSI